MGEHIGEYIRSARKEANMTQAELAQKVGLATITIRQYETGKREPRLSSLVSIASALNIPVARLYGLNDPETPELQQALDEAIKESEDEQGNIDLDSFQENLIRRATTVKYGDLIELRRKTDILYLEIMKDKTDDDLLRILCGDFEVLNRVGKIEAVKRIAEMVSLRRFSTIFDSEADTQ